MYTKVRDLMTKKIITIRDDSTLAEADQLMKERRIRHLPVVNSDNYIIGLLSSKDLPLFPETADVSVAFFMSAPVLQVDENMPLKQTVYKMLENKVSSLMVTNQEQEVLGIITTDDLLWHLVTKLDQDTEGHPLLENLFNKETVGQIANQMSIAGI